MPDSDKIVTRFAPSPTGFMHVGNLRTGLFAWLWARKNKGTFILRIEDTDKKREVPGSIEHIKKSLRWIGMDWDEGPDVEGPHAPYVQSDRLSQLNIYEQYAKRLIEKGYAYADTKTEEELGVLRKKAEEEKRPFLYREHRPENPVDWKAGLPLRFKIKELKRTTWNDVVRGELSAGPEALDDFILIKSDGYPTYNFAHIVDDIEMGVTHVVRGQEFISSTPNYIAVYEALEAREPQYITAPPIMDEDGNKKMGKREGAKDVLEYEKEGYLPETMMNFLAFLGWNPGGEKEIFSKEELVQEFSLSKIQKSGARINAEKLDWLNREYILRSSKEEQMSNFKIQISNTKWEESEKVKDEIFMGKLLKIMLGRMHRWGEVREEIEAGNYDYLFERPVLDKEKILWKEESKEKAISIMREVLGIMEKEEDFENIKKNIFEVAEKEGKGETLWPLRYALSGKEKSPDPFTLIEILGVEETKKRIQNAIQLL